MINEIVEQSSSKYSKLRLVSTTTDSEGYERITVHGGLNGPGNWRDYISDILDLIDNLQEIYENVSIIDFICDSLDDVFTVEFAVKDIIEG